MTKRQEAIEKAPEQESVYQTIKAELDERVRAMQMDPCVRDSILRRSRATGNYHVAKSEYPIVDGPPKDTSCFVEMSEECARELESIFARRRNVNWENSFTVILKGDADK